MPKILKWRKVGYSSLLPFSNFHFCKKNKIRESDLAQRWDQILPGDGLFSYSLDLFCFRHISGVSLTRSHQVGASLYLCVVKAIQIWMPSCSARGETGSISSDWIIKEIKIGCPHQDKDLVDGRQGTYVHSLIISTAVWAQAGRFSNVINNGQISENLRVRIILL